MKLPEINADISLASSLPATFYTSREIFDETRDKIFAASWQLAEGAEHLKQTGDTLPFYLLPGFLNEPLVLVRNATDELSCFSNVCTHRGNILIQHAGKYNRFICNYHGRKFSTTGKYESMPEFSEAKNFPGDCEDLHQLDVAGWNQFPFVSLKRSFDLQTTFKEWDLRVGFLPVNQFRYAPEYSKEYLVNAHWALYCDNYLEGFHIPFVHAELNKLLDYSNYTTMLFEYFNLQIGIAGEGEECFTLPKGHIDYGKKVGAYYFWLFPNMMFNFYPWGLSVNVVKPLSEKQCKVSFITYIFDEAKFNQGAGALMDKVEREDEFVVENVQRGINSRFYNSGRFSPTKEKGVHHFHRLLSQFMNR